MDPFARSLAEAMARLHASNRPSAAVIALTGSGPQQLAASRFPSAEDAPSGDFSRPPVWQAPAPFADGLACALASMGASADAPARSASARSGEPPRIVARFSSAKHPHLAEIASRHRSLLLALERGTGQRAAVKRPSLVLLPGKAKRDGLGSLWNMSGPERGELISSLDALAVPLMAGVSAKTKASYSSTVERKWIPVMEFLNLDPYEVTFSKWMLFALIMATKRSPAILGATIVTYLSHLSGASVWMPELRIRVGADDKVAKFNRMLVKLYPNLGPGRKILGMRLLKLMRRAMLAALADLEKARLAVAAGSPAAAELASAIKHITTSWFVFCTHWQGLLRNSELRNLTRRQVKLGTETDADGSVHRRVTLTLVRTKGNAGAVDIAFPERMDDFDVYRQIEARLLVFSEQRALLAPASREAALDLPFFDLTDMGCTASAVVEVVTTELRRWLMLAGIPADEMAGYVCHSLRHGGASDMLDSNIAPEIVAKLGRWASLVWFEVYRHLSSLSSRQLLKLGTNEAGSTYF